MAKLAKSEKKMLDGLRALRPSLDPGELLMVEMARTQVLVEALDEALAELSTDDIQARPEVISVGEGGAITWHPTQELVKTHLEQRKHLANLATTALKIGLAERSLEQNAEQARMMFQLLMAIMLDPALGLTSAQQAKVKGVLASKLRAIEA